MLPLPTGPARRLALATLVNTLGNGLFFSVAAIFYTRSVGLTNRQVGAGLTIAAAVGLAASIPAGRLSDRYGAKPTLVVVLVLQALATLGQTQIHSWRGFVAVATGVMVLDRAANAVRSALIAGITTGADRVRNRAYLRAVTNVGIGAGSLLAGIALHLDTRGAYVTVIALDALSYAVTAALLAGLPATPAAPRESDGSRRRAVVWRDRPFLALTGLTAIMCLHYPMLEIAVPLWAVQQTSAPTWVVALCFTLNTVMCVLLQVRASQGTDDVAVAARSVRSASALLAASCLVFYSASHGGPVVAVLLLALGALVQVLGEVRQAAGAWGLGYGLAPEDRQGEYQGVWVLSFSLANLLGPVLLTAVVLQLGLVGWAVLAGLFLVGGALTVPTAATALAAREREVLARC